MENQIVALVQLRRVFLAVRAVVAIATKPRLEGWRLAEVFHKTLTQDAPGAPGALRCKELLVSIVTKHPDRDNLPVVLKSCCNRMSQLDKAWFAPSVAALNCLGMSIGSPPLCRRAILEFFEEMYGQADSPKELEKLLKTVSGADFGGNPEWLWSGEWAKKREREDEEDFESDAEEEPKRAAKTLRSAMGPNLQRFAATYEWAKVKFDAFPSDWNKMDSMDKETYIALKGLMKDAVYKMRRALD